MRSSHLLTYFLIICAVFLAGSGIAADTGGGGSDVTLPDLPPAAAIEGAYAMTGIPDAAVADPEGMTIDSVGYPDGEGQAEGISTVAAFAGFPPSGKPSSVSIRSYRYFPALYNPKLAAARPALVPGSGTGGPPALAAALPSALPAAQATALRALAPSVLWSEIPILANNQILAFYGHPFSKRMGILGEYPKEDLTRLLKGYAKLYDEANGREGVIPAFYLIYGTCWPGGDIGYLKESVVKEYIEYAASQGMIVFIDHQIGKFPVEDAVKRLLPYLKYPNVHVALDPEWRTTLPMEEIGSITAEEVNTSMAMIRDYLDRQGIPGVKMLVIHQFRPSMIQGRERVRANNERVLLIHTADGFGPPALKKNAYALNALANNMPLKGFKLFFKTKVPGAGFDEPLLTPPEVLSLTPRPALIIYQ